MSLELLTKDSPTESPELGQARNLLLGAADRLRRIFMAPGLRRLQPSLDFPGRDCWSFSQGVRFSRRPTRYSSSSVHFCNQRPPPAWLSGAFGSAVHYVVSSLPPLLCTLPGSFFSCEAWAYFIGQPRMPRREYLLLSLSKGSCVCSGRQLGAVTQSASCWPPTRRSGLNMTGERGFQTSPT